MKTAEEYLKIWQGDEAVISKDIAIIAMKEYAKQFIEEASNQAIIKDEDNNDHWYECFPIPSVDKESILSLKDFI